MGESAGCYGLDQLYAGLLALLGDTSTLEVALTHGELFVKSQNGPHLRQLRPTP